MQNIPKFFKITKNNIEHTTIIDNNENAQILLSFARICNGQIEGILRYHNILFEVDYEIIHTNIINQGNCRVYNLNINIDNIFFIANKIYENFVDNMQIINKDNKEYMHGIANTTSVIDSENNKFKYDSHIQFEIIDDKVYDNKLWNVCLDLVVRRYLSDCNIDTIRSIFLMMTKTEISFIILK